MNPNEVFALRKMDAFEFLRHLPNESVDLCITDPPYESLERHRKKGTTTRLKQSKASSNTWFPTISNDRFPDLFSEIYRVLRKNSHFYMFCDSETMFVAMPVGEQAGFKFWKPIVWDKVKIGMGYHYRARYEFILFFEKGKQKLRNLGIPDILVADRIKGGYPTEKPVEISEILVTQSSEEGMLVCDPFMGSGSVGVASIMQNRRFIGCDTCSQAVELTRDRIRSIR